jgi:hypothetical protein
MIIILILGFIIIFAGAVLLIAPNVPSQTNQFLNKKKFDENTIYAQRILVAINCLAVGGMLLLRYFNNQIEIQIAPLDITNLPIKREALASPNRI